MTIPFTTVRAHVEVEHWQNTSGLSWLQIGLLHEDEHRSEHTHTHGVDNVMVRTTATQLKLQPVIEDVAGGGAL